MTEKLPVTDINVTTEFKKVQSKVVFEYVSYPTGGQILMRVKGPGELEDYLMSIVESTKRIGPGVSLVKFPSGRVGLSFRDLGSMRDYLTVNEITVDKISMEEQLMMSLEEAGTLLRNYKVIENLCKGEREE